jgi:hypothetical protein
MYVIAGNQFFRSETFWQGDPSFGLDRAAHSHDPFQCRWAENDEPLLLQGISPLYRTFPKA